MKLIIQRVESANVSTSKGVISQINRGFLILIGIAENDNDENIEWLAKKTTELRIFPDVNDLMNLSIMDVDGKILLVSQFTLYANCKKGRRPSFVDAAKPLKAEKLYLKFADSLRERGVMTEMGVFGADMKVSLVNDGPVTIILEK